MDNISFILRALRALRALRVVVGTRLNRHVGGRLRRSSSASSPISSSRWLLERVSHRWRRRAVDNGGAPQARDRRRVRLDVCRLLRRRAAQLPADAPLPAVTSGHLCGRRNRSGADAAAAGGVRVALLVVVFLVGRQAARRTRRRSGRGAAARSPHRGRRWGHRDSPPQSRAHQPLRHRGALFGLLALWVFNRAEERPTRGGYFASGVLVGLASIGHLYGIFWGAALATMLLIRRRWRFFSESALWLLLAGVAMTWLPWLGYIATGWADFTGQMRFVSPRFDLSNPAFFTGNLRHGGGPLSIDWLQRSLGEMPASRIGAWSAIAGLPLALTAIFFSARRRWGTETRRSRSPCRSS